MGNQELDCSSEAMEEQSGGVACGHNWGVISE
jgi:hypothetical protein